MSPDELVFGRAPPTLFEPPSVMDPVSNLDFLPVDDAFALEMRSESIEQLVGGDALRRGESERIEAGRSQANAGLVAGRDRVRVQGTLHEHTGYGFAEQAAHLHTTVDGTLDVHAASEDTVLLAGHMSDLWDGGAAIVAAMTDDTVAGGGIRVTTPLDLWVHGLMGVEERIGTCTADAVLLELGATHYEREYGPGAHAAGLAVYAGSLYQSSRSTFRTLMRVSSGVRNLIAGVGGEGEGGGRAPGASPPPAPAAGGAGTQAASETLSTATGAGGTAQARGMAGVRSEDLTGIHRGDEVAALASGANVVGSSGDLTGLRRGTETAGQLAALRDAMRGGEAGPQGELTSVSRVSEPDDTAPVHEACALDILTDIHSGATVPGSDAPALHSTVSPRKPPPGVKLGLLGGGGDAVRPASSDFESWMSSYDRLHIEYERHRSNRNWIATRAFGDATSDISTKLIAAYVEFGGSIDALKGYEPYSAVAGAYRGLQDLARQAEDAGDIHRASGIGEILASIHQLTDEFIAKLGARTDEFDRAYVAARRIRPLDARIDRVTATNWIEEQLEALRRKAADWVREHSGAGGSRQGDEEVSLDPATGAIDHDWYDFLVMAHRDVYMGLDPRVGSYDRIRYAAECDRVDIVEEYTSQYVRLLEAMADPSMRRPVVQGWEAGGATPPRFRTVDSGAAGRLGEIPRDPVPSSSATAGADAGELGRGMLDQPGVGPAGEAHPGTATPRSDDARAMATPELGAQATFRLRPVDPVPAPGTVRFDAGLQRAGQQPQHSGEAAFGGTGVHPPFVPDPDEFLDPRFITVESLWSEDVFNVERALTTGRLPRLFDSYRAMRRWRRLAKETKIDTLLESRLLPTPAIDWMIERLRAAEGGRGHIELIPQLEAMKESIDRALTNAYGYRADADWLANVDKFLKSGSAAQAMEGASVSGASRGEDIVGGARTSLQPARVESAAAPGPTERGAGELSPGAWSPAQDPWGLPWSEVGSDAGELSPGAWSPVQDPWSPWSEVGSGAGELSPGAWSPVQDPWSPWSQVRFGEVEVVRSDATQPVGSLGAGGRGLAVGSTGGWQAAETPGFGRLASISADLTLSHREGIVRRLLEGEALSAASPAELRLRYERAISAGTVASPAPRARTADALMEELGRLFTVARESPASAAQEDIDWAGIELMLRLLDAPGR